MSQNVLLKPITQYKRYSSYLELHNNIEIPDIQRNVIPKQVHNMELYIQECINKSIEPVFGTLDLVSIKGDPKLHLVDGQHRLLAIKNMYFNNKVVIPIHTMIYNVETYEDLENIFRLRNLGVPIPEYYINLKQKADTKLFLVKEITSYLEAIPVFSYKRNTRPYINLPIFIEGLIQSKLFSIINSMDDFINILYKLNLNAYNTICSLDEKGKRRLGITQNMINTWSEHKMYIPYDSNMVYFSKDFDIAPFMEPEK